MACHCLLNKFDIQIQQFVKTHLSTSLAFHGLKSSYYSKYKLLPLIQTFLEISLHYAFALCRFPTLPEEAIISDYVSTFLPIFNDFTLLTPP